MADTFRFIHSYPHTTQYHRYLSTNHPKRSKLGQNGAKSPVFRPIQAKNSAFWGFLGEIQVNSTKFRVKIKSLFRLFIRKLSFFSKLNKQLVCSFSKLIRMICVILSFQIGSNLVGLVVSFQPIGKSFGSHISGDIVKKSAFNNWSYNRFKFEVSIRV